MNEDAGAENSEGIMTSEGPSLSDIAVVCAAASNGFFPLTRLLFEDYLAWKYTKDTEGEKMAGEQLTNMRIQDNVYANRFDQVRAMLDSIAQKQNTDSNI